MGVAYYIVLDRQDPGFDPFVNGKFLAQRAKPLERLARSLNVRPLLDFFSISADDARAFLEDEGLDEDEVELPEQQWFSPADGLATVRALRAHLTAHPDAVQNTNNILNDLEEFEQVLQRAAEANCRWHLAVDT